MSRTTAGTPFTVCYKTEVTSIICGHHVYKEVWDAAIREMLETASDDQEEAKEYDINMLLVCTKKISSLNIYNRNFKFLFPFHQPISREQNRSIDNWKTAMGNGTCHSGKFNFHNKQ